jgi:transcriptional regulator with XRE-family HTH domain
VLAVWEERADRQVTVSSRQAEVIGMATEPAFGVRLKALRQRRGLSREVFGGLVGRSSDWVKSVETGRLLMPRLPILLRIAEVLQLDDLADLVGDQSPLPVESVTRGAHDHGTEVADALLSAPDAPVPDQEPDLAALTARIDDGWRRWCTLGDQKTAVADLLPDVLATAHGAVRALDGTARRHALAALARAYTLAQCYFAWQPASELVWLAADRARAAAQDADDPLAMAAAARYYAEVYRTAGQAERASVTALDAARGLGPAAGPEHRARRGALYLCAAQAEAQLGRGGDAWRHWDLAAADADALGKHYVHPWLRFGRIDCDGFALWISNRLMRPGETLQRADQYAWASLPSPGRRAARLLDVAEAHLQRREPTSSVRMIGRAYRESAETVRFSLWARQALLELAGRPGAVRQNARKLATAVGVPG